MNKPLDHIHHLAIQVSNIANAVQWYSKQYQCTVEYQDETWAMLKFANTSLALVLPEQHPYHFAIVRDDISAYGQATPHRDGTTSVYIQDPDHNHIEMLTVPDTNTSSQ